MATPAAAPVANPWVVAISVMLATFMEVLDTAIASVALPYIAGSLAASNSEATWVLTSYLIANAVILPASNWFALRFGRKRFLISCVVLFTIASFFCGAAPTLAMLLVARVLQGAGGGGFRHPWDRRAGIPRRLRYGGKATSLRVARRSRHPTRRLRCPAGLP